MAFYCTQEESEPKLQAKLQSYKHNKHDCSYLFLFLQIYFQSNKLSHVEAVISTDQNR